jgi:hypothetical protein
MRAQETHMETKKETPSLASLDWTGLAHAAFESPFIARVVGGALEGIARVVDAEGWLERVVADVRARQSTSRSDTDDAETDESSQIFSAADLLGIQPDASESEIRAALRSRLASSRLHPDHGGDGEEAKRLIAAQNLLIARQREARGP